MSLSLYIYIYICICIYTHTHISIPLSLSLYIYMYMCVYIYIYIYTSLSLYTYIYIHTLYTNVDPTVDAPIAQLVKGRLSDAGGPRFESQTGRVTGKSIPSLWRDRHPATKGLRPPEHDSGHSIRTKKTPPNSTNMYVCMYVRMYVCMNVCIYIYIYIYIYVYTCMYVCT